MTCKCMGMAETDRIIIFETASIRYTEMFPSIHDCMSEEPSDIESLPGNILKYC